MTKISAQEAGVVEHEEIDDPEVDAAASYALQQLSQASNSLFPFQLKELVSATKTHGTENSKSDVVHHMKMRIAAGNMADQIVEVDVVDSAHGHSMLRSNFIPLA